MSVSRDLVNNMSAVASLAPKARTASENGTGVDLRDYRSAAVVVVAGAITDGTHTIEIQDSADNSTFAAVASAYLQGTEPVLDTNDDDSLAGRAGPSGLRPGLIGGLNDGTNEPDGTGRHVGWQGRDLCSCKR